MSSQLLRSMIMAIAALSFAGPLLAQGRSTVTGAELDAAIATGRRANGAAVLELLSGERAVTLAGQMGVTRSELTARVASLDQAELDELADRSGLTERKLAGGANTIVISTTALIVILLIVILLS